MDQFKLAEFAKNSENKENPATFTQAVQEEGIEQGSLIISKLYNTMLGDITRSMKSWNAEIVKVLNAAGITPSALTNEQLYSAILNLIRNNSMGIQLGDLVANIGTTSPIGRVLCNGQRLVNCKNVFPDFYNFVQNKTPYKTVAEWEAQKTQYGQCGYCAIDGDDVIVPLITRTISGISNINQTGQAILDTMRPITGGVCKVNEHINEGDRRFTSGAFFMGERGSAGSGNGVKGGSADAYTPIGMNSGLLGAAYNGLETRGKQVQYPYYIQVYTAPASSAMVNVAELVELVKTETQTGLQVITATGGTIPLKSGGIYSMKLSEATSFVLPTPMDRTLLNQILVQLEIAADVAINWGTTNYFSGTPSASIGKYNMIWEYDNNMSAWVVGQLEKIEG